MRDKRVLSLFVTNWVAGILMGAALAAALLAADAGGLASLLIRSDAFWPGAALLFGGFAITFGGVVCASAVMMNAGRSVDDGRGGPPVPAGALRQEIASPRQRSDV